MNSSTLQQNYPEIYRKLFSKCPIVLSVPLTFYWTEHPSHYSGVMLRQKIPLRVFLGVEFTDQSGIHFSSLTFFSVLKNTFLEESLKDFFPNVPELTTFLEKQLRECLLEKARGLKFHVFVEDTVYGYPNGIRSSICALLASIIRLLSDNLSVEQIQRWRDISVKSLLHDRKYGFHETFQLARTINLIDSYSHSWTTVCFSAMVPTAYPIISFPAQTIRTLDYLHHKKSKFDTLHEIPFWGYDLRDIYPDLISMIDNPLVWPIDLAVIYSGKSILKGYGKLKTASTDFTIKNVQQFIKNNFANDIEALTVPPDFYQKFYIDQPTVDHFTTDLFSVISIRLIQQLYKLLSEGYNDDVVDDFINLIHSRHAALVGADPMSNYMRRLFYSFNSALFQGNPSANFALFAMYDVALGGNIGFVSPIGTHRDILESAVKELQQQYPDVSIEYMSWRDGYCSDGVIVEQYLDQSIISHHLGKDLVKVVQYTKRGHRDELVSAQDIRRFHETSDVILDLIEKDMTIGNQTISSKEIHSRTATIQLLTTLLQSPNGQIQNQDLPRSAYSLSKNEMQGKITGPLSRLVSKRTGKKLEIVLKGTNTEFSIALKFPEDFNLTTIQKLFN